MVRSFPPAPSLAPSPVPWYNLGTDMWASPHPTTSQKTAPRKNVCFSWKPSWPHPSGERLSHSPSRLRHPYTPHPSQSPWLQSSNSLSQSRTRRFAVAHPYHLSPSDSGRRGKWRRHLRRQSAEPTSFNQIWRQQLLESNRIQPVVMR